MTELNDAVAAEGVAVESALADLRGRIGDLTGPLLQQVADANAALAALQSVDAADKAALQAALDQISGGVTAINAQTAGFQSEIAGIQPAPPAPVPAPVDAPPADPAPVTQSDAPPAPVDPAPAAQ